MKGSSVYVVRNVAGKPNKETGEITPFITSKGRVIAGAWYELAPVFDNESLFEIVLRPKYLRDYITFVEWRDEASSSG